MKWEGIKLKSQVSDKKNEAADNDRTVCICIRKYTCRKLGKSIQDNHMIK